MSLAWNDHETERREKRISQIQPMRWDWETFLCLFSVVLCVAAL